MMNVDHQNEMPQEKTNEKKRGRPKSSLSKLKGQRLRQRLQNIRNDLIETCKDGDIEMDELLGMIGFKYYMNNNDMEKYDFKKGQTFKKIKLGQDPYDKKSLKPIECLYLLDYLAIGKSKYGKLKQFLEQYIHLPNYNEVSEVKKTIIPKICNSINDGKWCNLIDLIPTLTRDTLQCLVEPKKLDLVENEVNVELTCGFDSSGNHAQFRSSTNESKNIILGNFLGSYTFF